MGSIGASRNINSGNSSTTVGYNPITENTSYTDIVDYLKDAQVIEITDVGGRTVRFAKGEPEVIRSYFDRTEGGPGFANVSVEDWVAEDSFRGDDVINRRYAARDFAGVASRLMGGRYGMPKNWKSIRRIK